MASAKRNEFQPLEGSLTVIDHTDADYPPGFAEGLSAGPVKELIRALGGKKMALKLGLTRTGGMGGIYIIPVITHDILCTEARNMSLDDDISLRLVPRIHNRLDDLRAEFCVSGYGTSICKNSLENFTELKIKRYNIRNYSGLCLSSPHAE